MKLYYSPGACSMASHILMHEWNIPHATVPVDLRSHKTSLGEDFYTINPKGYVPALILDNGQTLTENIAILVYLTDSKKPIDGDKYKFIEWLAFISTELHKTLGGLFAYRNGGPADVIQATKDKAAKRLQLIDAHLNGKQYMMGNDFTAVDAYLITVVNWCSMLNVDLQPYAHLNAYMKAHLARPSVQKALKAEGLVK